jgi:hypothetical protein
VSLFRPVHTGIKCLVCGEPDGPICSVDCHYKAAETCTSPASPFFLWEDCESCGQMHPPCYYNECRDDRFRL